MPNKFYNKKITPNDFRVLLDQAGMSETQFQMLTGRHRKMVVAFLDLNDQQAPSLSDLVILEYLAQHPDQMNEFMRIAKSYITGDSDSKS